MKLIIKLSIGSDNKSNANHYATRQEVYGGHTIHSINHNEDKDSYDIYIEKDQEIIPWKTFNKNMAISIEYNLEY